MTLPAGPSRLPAASACLIVLDGWGLAPAGRGNAVSLARTPVFDELWAGYPHTTLTAWGRAVGLPEGQMGNSEVGHLNLGAGSVIRQDLARIDDAIAAGELAQNEVLRAAFAGAERVHLLGLVSDGGVHSSLEHLRALIGLGHQLAVKDLVVHAFTDGRDTLPHAGAGYLRDLDRTAGARIGSVIGRYWAMDRDRRWERTQRAYDLLIKGEAPYQAASGEQAVSDAYARGETDEFIEPTLVGAEARIRPGDSVICFNFRPDRMRELTRALAEPGFGGDGEDLPGWAGRGDGGELPRALDDADELRGGLALSGRVLAGAPGDDAVGRARARGRDPAARRRDREVSARDVLLQRRRGGPAERRAARAGALATRRADV